MQDYFIALNLAAYITKRGTQQADHAWAFIEAQLQNNDWEDIWLFFVGELNKQAKFAELNKFFTLAIKHFADESLDNH